MGAREQPTHRKDRRRIAAAAAFEALEARRLLAQSIWAYPGADGKLLYKPLPLGDKIGDYTNVGYMAGLAPIPHVPTKVTVSPVAGDDTASIQSAIDAVEAMAPDAAGFRGAVLLNPGAYEIATSLLINTSGVVLRGSGQGQTVLVATGTEKDTLIRLDGNGARSQVAGSLRNVTDKYVPVGAVSFTVNDASSFAVGDQVIVERKATANWIHDIGMDRLTNPWTSRDVDMDRTITHVAGNVVTIDAPITQAIDATYGGATIWKYTAAGRLANVGVEYLTGESTFDPTRLSGSDRVDENHAEHFIGVDGVINGWVRNVTSKYFGYSCVNMTGPSKWVTVRDSQCLDPVSVVTGGRRYSFNMGDSVNVLWANLYARDGRHDYVQGSEVTGPNVVVDSRADKARSDTGPHHRYSTGTLWDNLDVNGNAINIQNRWNSGTGHGWAGANQVVWNSEASSFIVQNVGYPKTSAWNWAIGNVGTINSGNLTLTAGGAPSGTQGFYDSHGAKVDTRSLFHAQMAEKLAHENWMLREVRVGDADDYAPGDAADAASLADAAWRNAVQAASGKAVVGTDSVAGDQLVPLTFDFTRAPGTYVVGASLSLGLKSAGGGDTSGDTIYFESASRTYTWAQLGVTAAAIADGAVVIDLSKLLPALQDGRLNIAVSGNAAVDWATLNFQTAALTHPTLATLAPAHDAHVDQAAPTSNFGNVASLYSKLNGAAGSRESFLKFDLASLAGHVTSAYVRLVPTAVGFNATTFGSGVGAMFTRVSEVADDAWTEAAINWNNKPASGAFFREFVSYVNEPVTVDVTALVRAAQAGDKLLSLRLSGIVDDDNSEIAFASSEHANAAFRPQLVIQTHDALHPVADATVRGGASGAINYGGDADLGVKNDSASSLDNDRESFLRFDLSGLPASPPAAYLRLTPLAVPAVLQHGVALVPSDTWTESGITWNTRPASSTTALGTWTPRAGAWSQVALAPSAYAGDPLLSMKVYSVTASSAAPVQYHSRESADAGARPMLILTNLAPGVTAIPNLAGGANAPTAAQWFGVWDGETAAGSITVTATSSNPALLPAGNITFGGSGADRTFTLTPAAGQSGASTVTITVTDAQGQATSTTFEYLVTAPIVIEGDQDAPNQSDVFKVVRSGAFIDVFRNGTTAPVLHVDHGSAGHIAIDAKGGNDTIIVDFAGGDPIPAAGMTLTGGEGSADLVRVLDGPGADAFALAADELGLSGGGTAAYAGAEALALDLGRGGDQLASSAAAVTAGALLLNVVAAGSLRMAAGGALPAFTDLTLATGSTLDLNGQNQTIDAIAGSGGVTNGAAVPATLTVGQHGGSSTFAGAFSDGAAPVALTKAGTGTLTLTGNHDYTGATTIAGGAIAAAGSVGNFIAMSGQVRFDGGTLRVTGDATAPNFANKFTTSFPGATPASTGTIDVAAGVTLTIGGASASLQTNGGGARGGRFTKAGAGTLRIVGNNGQLDDPFNLDQGAVVVESERALGGADTANNRVEMKNGTTLVLRQDTSTSFLTPISVVDAGATVEVVIDRLTSGVAPVHTLNGLSSVGSFSLVVTRGPGLTSNTANLLLGAVTLGGNGTFDVGSGAAVGVTASLGGAFGVTKTGSGVFILGGTNSYTGATNVADGLFALAGNLTMSSAVNVAGGTLRVAPNQSRVIKTGGLSVTGTGKLDLTDNKLIVAGGNFDAVSSLIAEGYDGGGWGGYGIVTTAADAQTGLTTLAVAPADAVDYAGRTLGGVAVSAGDVIVMYTYGGDTNFDGKLDADDYGTIDFSVLVDGATGYFNGDFNFDGKIDADDYGVIDFNILAQRAAIPT